MCEEHSLKSHLGGGYGQKRYEIIFEWTLIVPKCDMNNNYIQQNK